MNQNVKIDPFGFREYDARWLYKKDINQSGIENLGKGLGSQIKIHTKKDNPRIIVGHDYRSYSEEIKTALKKGLLSTGCNIEDIGLSLSPMVYFAQFNLNADAVAMVTASHNENGWTGVKMGIKKGLTHAPEEMKELKEITLNEKFTKGEGNEKQIKDFDKIYKEDLISKNKIKMLSDPYLLFTKAIGAEVDRNSKGMGIRSNRYAMVIENLEVINIQVEKETKQCGLSSAEGVLEIL